MQHLPNLISIQLDRMFKSQLELIIAWYIFGYTTAGISTEIWFYGFVCPGLTDNKVTNGNLFYIFISWPLLNEMIANGYCLIFFDDSYSVRMPFRQNGCWEIKIKATNKICN